MGGRAKQRRPAAEANGAEPPAAQAQAPAELDLSSDDDDAVYALPSSDSDAPIFPDSGDEGLSSEADSEPQSNDANASGSDDGSSDEEGGEDLAGSSSADELDAAVVDYVTAAATAREELARTQRGRSNGRPATASTGNGAVALPIAAAGAAANGSSDRSGGAQMGAAATDAAATDTVQPPADAAAAAADPDSDSSEDERPPRNTVGDVPLAWYADEDHIGYDVEGRKLMRKARGDKLDALLARNDSSRGWRTIYDEYNDEQIVLSREEVAMIQRIREGRFPHVQVNPFEPELDAFTSERELHPLSSAPEPKRRFIPSKWEEKKVVRLVRALRKGWIRVDEAGRQIHGAPEQPPVYLMWADDGQVADKTGAGLTYVPAPKQQLPGHEASYNPAPEYLPSEEERAAARAAAEESGERQEPMPQRYSALRLVPAYDGFIREAFERCLDLYLCPRMRRKKLTVEPQALIPKLPKPSELRPYPQQLLVRYSGHDKAVTSVAPDASGQWLATGSADGSVKLWQVTTGRCMRTWQLGAPVTCVAWRPDPATRLLAATAGKRLLLFYSGTGTAAAESAAEDALRAAGDAAAPGEAGGAAPLAVWSLVTGGEGGGAMLEVAHRHELTQVAWHARGDYLATVAPKGNTQAVLVHQLSRAASQNPFRKNRGAVSRVAFHPAKPFFFVATQNHVRVYNLAKQALAKKLLAGSGMITSLALHPSGDHVLVGCADRRLLWFDLDLSNKPYRSLRYHDHALRGVAFHAKYPLFASGSDDAQVHVFHGMVYNDLMSNPLIVPVKVLKGHELRDYDGVRDVAFHPTQPWLFSAGGADHSAALFCDL